MQRGFTLIELLYTLAVAALVLTIGAPTFQSAIQNSRMTASVNNVVASLQLARSEAIKRRLPVSLCTTPDWSDEDATCDATSVWHEGWIVFVDTDGNGSRDSGEAILRAEGKMRGSVAVSTPSDQELQNALTYLPTGFPDLGGLAAAGVLLFCDNRQSDRFGRVIAVAQTGRPLATSVSERTDLEVTCE